MNDRTLMRLKDLILIAGALTGLFVGGFKIYERPIQLERRVDSIERFIPKIEQNQKDIAIAQTQYTEIIRRLDRIEKKLKE